MLWNYGAWINKKQYFDQIYFFESLWHLDVDTPKYISNGVLWRHVCVLFTSSAYFNIVNKLFKLYCCNCVKKFISIKVVFFFSFYVFKLFRENYLVKILLKHFVQPNYCYSLLPQAKFRYTIYFLDLCKLYRNCRHLSYHSLALFTCNTLFSLS